MEISILTHSEEQIMRVAWQLQSFFMKDLMEAFPEPKPHQNTISTYMRILTEKKYLSTEKVGRIFKYSVLVSQHHYLSYILNKMIEDNFSSDKELFAKFLVDQNILSVQDFRNSFEVKTSIVSIKQNMQNPQNPISDFIEEITKPKKKKKKDKKKKK